MRCKLVVAALVAALSPASGAAQGGSSTWTMRTVLPDSLASRTAGLSEFELRMTFATNGQMWAMQLQPAQSMVDAITAIDLSAVRFVALMPTQGDSFHLGIVIPPELGAQLGAGIGYRLDGVVPDLASLGGNLDSLVEAQASDDPIEKPDFRDTGGRTTVGGVACEQWTVTMLPPTSADSSGTREPMTMEICLAEQTPLLRSWSEWAKARVPALRKQYDKLGAEMRAQFGGRELVPIRIAMTAPLSTTFELVSQTDQAPDPTFFQLPDGLQPFPIEMVKAMLPKSQGS